MSCKIELYTNPESLQADELRLRLKQALRSGGLLVCWDEYYPGYKNIPRHLAKADVNSLFINYRLIWSENTGLDLPGIPAIVQAIQSVDKPPARIRLKQQAGSYSSFALSLFIAFLPKCPFCWASYMSVLGIFGIHNLAYRSWFLPASIALLSINIIAQYISRKRHNAGPFFLSLFGASIIVINRLLFDLSVLILVGAASLIVASLWNSLPKRLAMSVQFHLYKLIPDYAPGKKNLKHYNQSL